MLDWNESVLNDCLVCFLCSVSLHMTGGLNIHRIEQGYFLVFWLQSGREYTYRPKLAEEFPNYKAPVLIHCGRCIMYEPESFRSYLEVLMCVRHRGPMQPWTVFMHPKSWAGVINGPRPRSKTVVAIWIGMDWIAARELDQEHTFLARSWAVHSSFDTPGRGDVGTTSCYIVPSRTISCIDIHIKRVRRFSGAFETYR